MLLRPQRNLLALLALSAFAQAHWFEDTLNEVLRRQADNEGISSGSGSEPPAGNTSSPADNANSSPTPSTSPSVSPTTSETPSVTTSVTPSPSSTTSLAPSTTSNSISSSTKSDASSTTTSARETQSTKTTATPVMTIVRITVVATDDSGEVVTSVSESSSLIPAPTDTAELNGNNDSSSGGMSPKTKSTVIGVVVGIGGAILLAGLAVVAWRIWGRKKSLDEGDNLVDYGRPDTGAEKPLNSSGGNSTTNPFQKTLESYHNPDKRLNASSNF